MPKSFKIPVRFVLAETLERLAVLVSLHEHPLTKETKAQAILDAKAAVERAREAL